MRGTGQAVCIVKVDTELVQDAQAVGCHVEKQPVVTVCGRARLEHDRFDADPRQHDGGYGPADTSTDHQRAHAGTM
jgi:hypothetical protein